MDNSDGKIIGKLHDHTTRLAVLESQMTSTDKYFQTIQNYVHDINKRQETFERSLDVFGVKLDNSIKTNRDGMVEHKKEHKKLVLWNLLELSGYTAAVGVVVAFVVWVAGKVPW